MHFFSGRFILKVSWKVHKCHYRHRVGKSSSVKFSYAVLSEIILWGGVSYLHLHAPWAMMFNLWTNDSCVLDLFKKRFIKRPLRVCHKWNTKPSQPFSESSAKCRDLEFESDSLNESLLSSQLTPILNNESVFGGVHFKMNGEYL